MPSTATSGDSDVEPSPYADEFNVDPAQILAKNEETVLARVRGIVDLDLIDAYIDVEANRQAREAVIGALNQRKGELQECPRGCDAPILDRFVSTANICINHPDATQHRTCIITREVEGKPGIEVVYHDTSEGKSGEAEAETEEPAEQDDDGGEDQLPIGDTPKKLYEKMRTTEGTMNLAGIKGWAGTKLDLSPDETKRHLDALESAGYVEEVEDGVYEVTDG